MWIDCCRHNLRGKNLNSIKKGNVAFWEADDVWGTFRRAASTNTMVLLEKHQIYKPRSPHCKSQVLRVYKISFQARGNTSSYNQIHHPENPNSYCLILTSKNLWLPNPALIKSYFISTLEAHEFIRPDFRNKSLSRPEGPKLRSALPGNTTSYVSYKGIGFAVIMNFL